MAEPRGLTSEDGLGECFLKIIRQSFSEIVPMMDLCIDVRAVVLPINGNDSHHRCMRRGSAGRPEDRLNRSQSMDDVFFRHNYV